jgi:hypothetical protein
MEASSTHSWLYQPHLSFPFPCFTLRLIINDGLLPLCRSETVKELMEYEAERLCPPGIGTHYNVKNILQTRELISIHMHTFITLRRILIHRMILDFSEVPY